LREVLLISCEDSVKILFHKRNEKNYGEETGEIESLVIQVLYSNLWVYVYRSGSDFVGFDNYNFSL